jgi:hypothetical protein
MHHPLEVTGPNDLITSGVFLASSKQDRERNATKDPYLVASFKACQQVGNTSLTCPGKLGIAEGREYQRGLEVGFDRMYLGRPSQALELGQTAPGPGRYLFVVGQLSPMSQD